MADAWCFFFRLEPEEAEGSETGSAADDVVLSIGSRHSSVEDISSELDEELIKRQGEFATFKYSCQFTV